MTTPDPTWDPRSAAYASRLGNGCAAVRWTRPQQMVAALLVMALAAALVRDPWSTAVAGSYALAGAFLLALLVRLTALGAALVRDPTLRPEPASGDDLPVYAVLVPLYREPAVVPHLVAALAALDYPVDRLDIHLLLESDDALTRCALEAHGLPRHWRITTAPPGRPRTKPRACNTGLDAVRPDAEFLVIFDAEDRPETDQLRKAVAAYRTLPPEVVCLQARLGHYNARQSLVAGWSAVEYLAWFQLHLPGLQTLNAPIPLGGTSNHFRLLALRDLAGWDPFNVTEDCDLGLRLARRGWRTAILASTTWEEAVTTVGAWVRQRSRWVKGYLQTWLVHTRTGVPGRLGPWGALWLTATVGGTVAMHLLNPVAWAVLVAWLVVGWSIVDVHEPWSLAALGCSAALVAANLLFLLTYVHASLRAGRRDLLAAALTMPLAWILHSVAAWKAVVDLVVRPFHWSKTTHGLAVVDAAPRQATEPAPALATWHLVALPLVALIIVGLAAWVVEERGTAHLTRDWAAQTAPPHHAPVVPTQQPLRYAHLTATSLVAGTPANLTPWRLVQDPSTPSIAMTGPAPVFAIDLHQPGLVDLASSRWRNLSGATALAVDAWLPAQAPHWMTLTTHLRDEDGRWYQHTAEQRLLPGGWTRVEIPLDLPWEAHRHHRPWCREVLARVKELGFQIDGQQSYRGELRLANLRRLDAPQDALHTVDLTPGPAQVAVMERWELRTRLSRCWENPFDPAQVDAALTVTRPDGREETVNAFWAQDYDRRLEEGREIVEPVGVPTWRVRYRARLAGPHAWRLRVQDATGTVEVAQGSFTALPSPAAGYVRRSAERPEYFCLDDGTPYWPIGQNICQPVDLQQPFPYPFVTAPDQGTYTFDRFLARMGDAGMTWGRLWLTPWSLGLEGSAAWTGFHGLGRYSQANAWRLDHVLAEAQRRGVRIQPTLMHQAELVQRSAWRTSIWNHDLGGPLQEREDFFTDPAVRTAFRKRLRYLIARWGDDPTITGWEFFGEANLMPGYDEGAAAAWHQEMIDEVRRLDLGRHLVFTHTHNWQNGHRLWALDGIDIIQGNGYIRPPNRTTDHLDNFDRYLAEVAHYRKPVLVAEYGGKSELGAPNGDYLEAQLHSGLWASAVEPFAGAAMPWWWDYTEGADLYHHFRALALATAGMDRTRHDYRTVRPALVGADGDWRAAGLQDRTAGGLYWIHHRRIFDHWQDLPQGRGFRLRLTGLQAGRWRITAWDTNRGGEVHREERDLSGDDFVDLPALRGDLGLRIDPLPP